MNNHIPELISRRGCPVQMAEMKNFLNLAIKENLCHYINELMYCSNSDTCFFELNEIVQYRDPIYQKVEELASITITQFSLLDNIHHAKWVIDDFGTSKAA